MKVENPRLKLWLVGLALFAVLIVLGIWLERSASVGIVDHQLAGDAATVDAIQAQWRDEGVRWLAIVSMLGDLVFIGAYGWGAWIAGRSFVALGNGPVRLIGWIVAVAAAVFLFTDYAETILQFIQLMREEGSDSMAATAAAMQNPKKFAWVATFVGVIAALVIRRFARPRA